MFFPYFVLFMLLSRYYDIISRCSHCKHDDITSFLRHYVSLYVCCYDASVLAWTDLPETMKISLMNNLTAVSSFQALISCLVTSISVPHSDKLVTLRNVKEIGRLSYLPGEFVVPIMYLRFHAVVFHNSSGACSKNVIPAMPNWIS